MSPASLAFVTTTELEHGSDIIAALLDEVVGHLSPPLEIQEIEGDAVFALGGRGRLRCRRPGCWRSWRRRSPPSRRGSRRCRPSRRVTAGRASRSGTLDLKMVVHHGPFLRHTVGGRSRVTGTAVILVHRLLKNGVERKGGYALLTEPVLRSLGHRRRARRPPGAHGALRAPGRRPLLRPRPRPTPSLSPRGEGRVRGQERVLHPQAIA